MPSKIVDLSARSEIIRNEPFHVHFWECTPAEYLRFLGQPHAFLAGMGIKLPKNCRIETVIENHDWLGAHAADFQSDNGTIICNVGGGNIARQVYRIVSYGHDHSTIGKFRKQLLHSPDVQQVGEVAAPEVPVEAADATEAKTEKKGKDKAKSGDKPKGAKKAKAKSKSA